MSKFSEIGTVVKSDLVDRVYGDVQDCALEHGYIVHPIF